MNKLIDWDKPDFTTKGKRNRPRNAGLFSIIKAMGGKIHVT